MSEVRTAEQMQTLAAAVVSIPLHQFLGLQVLGIQSGQVRLRLHAGERTLNTRGKVHGGLLSAVLEAAGGLASSSMLPPTLTAVTVDYHLQMMRAPTPHRDIEVVARVVRPGRNLFFCESQALVDGKLCASAQITKAVQQIT
jgi:uncharacterized protein (TIGR00369 family)